MYYWYAKYNDWINIQIFSKRKVRKIIFSSFSNTHNVSASEQFCFPHFFSRISSESNTPTIHWNGGKPLVQCKYMYIIIIDSCWLCHFSIHSFQLSSIKSFTKFVKKSNNLREFQNTHTDKEGGRVKFQ